jgi:hypothetical protein
LGKASLIDKYWEVFLLFGAAIQMIDDWTDLEKDLTAGHYSYLMIGAEDLRNSKDVKRTARLLRSDLNRVQETYRCSKDMIARSRSLLGELNDPYLTRLVDVTELRLDSYFRKELSMK